MKLKFRIFDKANKKYIKLNKIELTFNNSYFGDNGMIDSAYNVTFTNNTETIGSPYVLDKKSYTIEWSIDGKEWHKL